MQSIAKLPAAVIALEAGTPPGWMARRLRRFGPQIEVCMVVYVVQGFEVVSSITGRLRTPLAYGALRAVGTPRRTWPLRWRRMLYQREYIAGTAECRGLGILTERILTVQRYKQEAGNRSQPELLHHEAPSESRRSVSRQRLQWELRKDPVAVSSPQQHVLVQPSKIEVM